MLTTLLCLSVLVSADPSPEQVKLLKVFRSEFVQITPGERGFPKHFQMGRQEGGSDSERPVHKVTITHSFGVAKYEVPQNLWQAVLGSNPSRWKGPRNSVEMLSFAEAEQFCKKATEWMRAAELIEPTQRIRLPSEAEWEYFARAGTDTVYSFGDDPKKHGDFAWSTENAAGNDPPVGAKKPNAWGLYDIHGYLWEWCADSQHLNYDGAPTDGTVWLDGGDARRRVLRGGSWKDRPDQLTSSHRRFAPAATRDDAIGLRCVLAND